MGSKAQAEWEANKAVAPPTSVLQKKFRMDISASQGPAPTLARPGENNREQARKHRTSPPGE
jgi:hypothetical protein